MGTNVPGPAGAGACNDHGQCSDGAGGSGSCSCDLSYYVRTAAISAPGEPRTRAQGMVDAARFLALVPARPSDAGHWTGSDRCACASGYHGPSCTQCPECGDGSCNEGVTGDRWCTCVSAVYGPNCGSQCAGGKSNPCNGRGSGDEGATGPGVCTCATSYLGSDCTGECLPCAANPCNGHGTCNDADGTCTCDSGYFGAPYGNVCPQAAGAGACNSHGQCSDGTGGSGSCSCYPGYSARVGWWMFVRCAIQCLVRRGYL